MFGRSVNTFIEKNLKPLLKTGILKNENMLKKIAQSESWTRDLSDSPVL